MQEATDNGPTSGNFDAASADEGGSEVLIQPDNRLYSEWIGASEVVNNTGNEKIQLFKMDGFRHERLFIRRVLSLSGWALHGLVFDYVDGTRGGFMMHDYMTAATSLKDKALSERGGMDEWTYIDYGDYITRVTGHALNRRQKFLCHELELHFHSGRTLKFSPSNSRWRGDPFDIEIPPYCLPFQLLWGNGTCFKVGCVQTSLHCNFLASDNAIRLYPNKQQLMEMFKYARKIDNKLDRALSKNVWLHVFQYLSSSDVAPYETCEFEELNSRNWQRELCSH